MVFWPCWRAASPQTVKVLDDGLHEVGAQLHLANTGFGLRVGDAEASPGYLGETICALMVTVPAVMCRPASCLNGRQTIIRSIAAKGIWRCAPLLSLPCPSLA